jgi:glycerophosphoryl diester phosphodiesterase
LYEIRKLDPEATIGFLFTDLYLDPTLSFKKIDEILLIYASRIEAQILSLDHQFLRDQEHVESLKKHGFRIASWTANTPEEWLALIDKGVDSIVTDYPIDLIELLTLYDEKLNA